MKSIAKAVMIGTLILAAQGALAADSGFPSADPEFIGLPANITYASAHANDRVTAVQPEFPSSDPEFIGLPARDTYASEHANDSVTTAQSVFPSEDPEFVGLPANVTYESEHANDRVAAHFQPVQRDTMGR